jgi:hypothetical protein
VDEHNGGRRGFGEAVRALNGKFRVGAVTTAAVAMTIVVVLIGVAAWLSLDEAGRRGVFGKIAELSYQFVVVVLLGTLLKKVIDDAQERRVVLAAQRDQRAGFVRRLVDVSHRVELARVLVRANRSVKTWSEQMNERVIVAYIGLRDVLHDLNTAAAAGTEVFAGREKIVSEIRVMETYLKRLIDEFAARKKGLSELQREAERDRSRQDEVWERLCKLDCLGDLVSDTGAGYGQFRSAYANALTHMHGDVAQSSTAAT